MVIQDDIKLENVLTPVEMWRKFGDIEDWKLDGREVYINSSCLMAELLRGTRGETKYEVLVRNVPYAYRRIVKEAESSREPSVFDVVLGRRLENLSGNH
jgi:hypothetical protein